MRNILITGGSGKVGKQLVQHFLKEGWAVGTTTRNASNFDVESFANAAHLNLIEIDLMHNSSSIEIVEKLNESSFDPDVIIHNARNAEYLKIVDKSHEKEDLLAKEYMMDVVKPLSITDEILKMESSKLSNVIFISSIYGVVGPTPALYDDFESSSPIQYGLAKAAQIHLTKELAIRYAPSIRVNCVSFGGIKGRTNVEFEKKYGSLNPQDKMLEEIDVVDPVSFLVSDGSKNMTGHNLVVDGGWTIW